MKAAQDFVQAFKEQGGSLVAPNWNPPEEFLDELAEKYDYKNALEWDEFAQLMMGTEHFRVDGKRFRIDGPAEEAGTKELLEAFTRYFCPPSVMGSMLAFTDVHPLKAIALAESAREGVTKKCTHLRRLAYWQTETVRQVIGYFDSLPTDKAHDTQELAKNIKGLLGRRKKSLVEIGDRSLVLDDGYDSAPPLHHYEDFVTSYMMHRLLMPADAVQVEKGEVCFAPGVFEGLEYFDFDKEITR